MNSKRSFFYGIVGVSIFTLLLFWGCSIEKNHKLLSLFFDGVDQQVYLNNYLSKDSISKDAVRKREALLQKNRPDQFVHRPFKEKKCLDCHTPDKHLIKPLPELCYKCHNDFRDMYKYVHGPVAAGNCLNCHHQHYGKYQYVLVRSGQDLCTYCHSPAIVFKSKIHQNIEDVECTKCHNPHGGNNRFMLREAIVKSFKGQSILKEIASRHLYGQIYANAPGDIRSGVEVKIMNGDTVVVTTVYTDSSGVFSFENMHSDINYTFKLSVDSPHMHLNVLDYEKKVVASFEKNRKGKFKFDKNAYETAHADIAEKLQPLSNTYQKIAVLKPEIYKLYDTSKRQDGTSNDTTKTGLAVNSEKRSNPLAENEFVKPKEENKIASLKSDEVIKEIEKEHKNSLEESKKVNADSKIVENTNPMPPVKVPEQNTQTEPTEANKEIESKSNSLGNSDVKEVEPKKTTNNTGVSKELQQNVVEKIPNVVSNIENKINKEEPTTPLTGDEVKIERKVDVVEIKLSGKTFKFTRGAMVCVIGENGEIITIAKINNEGNFEVGDFALQNKEESQDEASSQLVLLNYETNVPLSNNKSKKSGNGAKQNSIHQNVSQDNDGSEATEGDVQPGELYSTVYFDYAKTNLSNQTKAELNKVVDYLKKNVKVELYVQAHTDARGSKKYNLSLSNKRAQAACDYLVAHGIKRKRIVMKGFGKDRLINKCDADVPCSEAEHQKNRRIEIFITDK